MRVLFAGTPDTAVPSLRRVASEHDVVTVVTRPDAPVGRKRVLTPSPVAAAAAELGLPTLKTSKLDAEATAELTRADVDVGVVVAYGAIIRPPLLTHPRRGWINLHFSLLPRWRGAAPVQRAVMAGDEKTGVSIMALDEQLDTGAVYARRSLTIGGTTAGELTDRLAAEGADLLGDVLAGLGGSGAVAEPQPQSGEPTYAAKLSRDDGRIAWNRPRDEVLRHLQGVTPRPGAFTTVRGRALKILEFSADRAPRLGERSPEAGSSTLVGDVLWVGTRDEPVGLTVVQPAGSRAMAVADWHRGLRETPILGGE